MRPLALTLTAVGLAVFASALQHSKSSVAPLGSQSRGRPRGPSRGQFADAPLYQLLRDVPSLGLRRGQRFRLEPDALIHLDDLVVLRPEEPAADNGADVAGGELRLARYRDELMHCVAGRLAVC